MSTAVYVYSVDVDRLKAAPGSRDKQLLAASGQLKGFFATIDQIAEDEDEDEMPPQCAEAFEQIINGEPYANGFGYVYGYAYEGLCMAIGAETKQSWTQIARSYDWFKDIDKALKAIGIKLMVADLLNRGALIKIPTPDDFPGLGWWTAEEVAAAAVDFKTLSLNPLDGKIAKLVKPVADAIEDIQSWISVAAHRPGDWLIGVHS